MTGEHLDTILKNAAAKSEINVTPLVDVCLVLLIIFMVVTPMLQKGVPINLPVTEEPRRHPVVGLQHLGRGLRIEGLVGIDHVHELQLRHRDRPVIDDHRSGHRR